MAPLTDFIQNRLSITPQGHQWASLLLSKKDYNAMDLVREIQSLGFLCQTLSASRATTMGHREFMGLAQSLMKRGVIVIVTSDTQEELLELSSELVAWQQTVIKLSPQEAGHYGRLFFLLTKDHSTELNPQFQNLMDYSFTIN